MVGWQDCMLANIYPNQPIRAPHGTKTCYCNQVAFNEEPDKCDAVCNGHPMYDKGSCSCKDHRYAGEYCSQKLCKMSGHLYCERYYSGYESCSHVNSKANSMDDSIPYCKCEHGYLANGQCSCDRYYSGIFCQIYNPPPTPSTTTTERYSKEGWVIRVLYSCNQPAFACPKPSSLWLPFSFLFPEDKGLLLCCRHAKFSDFLRG